jgi:hypothetical protein
MKKRPNLSLVVQEEEVVFNAAPVALQDNKSEISAWQKQKKDLIDKQALEIAVILESYSDPEVQAILKDKKFKAEALEKALDAINPKLEKYNILENAYLDQKIGKVKSRDLDFFAPKEVGSTEGRFVRKSASGERALKHNITWLEKIGRIDGDDVGEKICEYIGTSLLNQMLGDDSPKIRLYKADDGSVKLMVKFIDEFESLDKCSLAQINSTGNKANFFAANILLGDYDTNLGNTGIRKDGEHVYLARIDNGKALSYKKIINHSDAEIRKSFLDNADLKPLNFREMKDKVYRDPKYKAGLFEGDEFNESLERVCSNFNQRRMSKVIDRCLSNVVEAFGEDVLKDRNVKRELQERMDLPEDFSKSDFKAAIMNNMSFMNDELLKFAKSKIKHKNSPTNIENIDVNISAVTVSTPKAEKQGYDSKGFSSGRERRKKSFVEQTKREIPFPAEVGRG